VTERLVCLGGSVCFFPALVASVKGLLCNAWFWAVEGVSGAGGRAYWVWCSGKGWVFICSELHFDKVNCTYRRRREGL